ncbi:MAG: translational machinery protein [Beijerinckiaceae bacterium]|jgi:stalled ribosome rescue protein Dom34
MTGHNHTVVWIDHREARVFHFSAEEVDRLIVWPNDPHVHIHHKAQTIGSGHAPEDQAFLHAVVEAIGASKAILVTGPGVAKMELVKHIARHDPAVIDRIAGIETADHPSDGALVAHARAYFRAAGRMTPQKQ